MPFNGPIDGDYTNVDFGKAPWTQECMTLTHDECIFCIDKFKEVEETYKPEDNYGEPISDLVIHSNYNRLDWQYAISWDTFNTLRGYGENTLGINEFGIIYPEPEPEPEPEVEEETPIEEEPVVEEETPNIYETLFGVEEPTEENPAE